VSCSYNDIAVRKQWWKVLATPFCHSSLLHACLVAASLLTVTRAELEFGSLYLLKYSFVLLAAQRALTLGATHWLVTRHGSALRMHAPHLVTVPSQGATGLVFAWLGMLSFRLPASPASLLGLVPVSFAYLPVLLMLVFQIAMPRSPITTVDCTVGLVSGYALSLGLLELLPPGDVYWTVCFLLDALLLGLHAAYSSSSRSGGGNDGDPVLPLVRPGSGSAGSLVTMSDLRVRVDTDTHTDPLALRHAHPASGAEREAQHQAQALDLQRALRESRTPVFR
jgi:membrane associated rhomboid family serine protease